MSPINGEELSMNEKKRPVGRLGAALFADEVDRRGIKSWLDRHKLTAIEFQQRDYDRFLLAVRSRVVDWVVMFRSAIELDQNGLLSLMDAICEMNIEYWNVQGNTCVSDNWSPRFQELRKLAAEIQRVARNGCAELEGIGFLQKNPGVDDVLRAIDEVKEVATARKSELEWSSLLKQLNQTQRKLYYATPESGPLAGEEIAAEAGVKFNASTKGHLSTLRKMGLIEVQPGQGYLRVSRR